MAIPSKVRVPCVETIETIKNEYFSKGVEQVPSGIET